MAPCGFSTSLLDLLASLVRVGKVFPGAPKRQGFIGAFPAKHHLKNDLALELRMQLVGFDVWGPLYYSRGKLPERVWQLLRELKCLVSRWGLELRVELSGIEVSDLLSEDAPKKRIWAAVHELRTNHPELLVEDGNWVWVKWPALIPDQE